MASVTAGDERRPHIFEKWNGNSATLIKTSQNYLGLDGVTWNSPLRATLTENIQAKDACDCNFQCSAGSTAAHHSSVHQRCRLNYLYHYTPEHLVGVHWQGIWELNSIRKSSKKHQRFSFLPTVDLVFFKSQTSTTYLFSQTFCA